VSRRTGCVVNGDAMLAPNDDNRRHYIDEWVIDLLQVVERIRARPA
jgi:hypothetical protein